MTKKQLRRLYNVVFVALGLALVYPVFRSSVSVLESIRYEQKKKQDIRWDEYYQKKAELFREGKKAEFDKLSRKKTYPSARFIWRNFKKLTGLMIVSFYVISYFLVYYAIVVLSKLFKWMRSYVKGQPSEAD